MRYRSMARQAGFTLIEIAIVLVIIGILIVGVLQGTEMIENSRTKSIVSTMKGVAAAYNSYVDRYRSVPGDELLATVNSRGWGTTVGGNGNGALVAAVANIWAPAAEGNAFWQVLYASGFLSGDQTAVGLAALPKHAGGGLIGVASGTIYGSNGTFVCAANLSGKQALAIDTAIDGPPNTTVLANAGNVSGIVRGASGVATAPLLPVPGLPGGLNYSETGAQSWTLCMKIG